MNARQALAMSLMFFAAGATAQTSAQEIDAANKAWRDSLPEATADYGAYPSNYETIVRAYLGKSLKDPESARYGEFTKPEKDQAIESVGQRRALYGYVTCVDVNAKNSYGGYTGAQRYWFLIRDDSVVRYGTGNMYIDHAPKCLTR
jgi:hypothetical protein